MWWPGRRPRRGTRRTTPPARRRRPRAGRWPKASWAARQRRDLRPHRQHRTAAATARVTLYFEDGGTARTTLPLPASSRDTVRSPPTFPDAAGRRFGTIVESIGGPACVSSSNGRCTPTVDGDIWAGGTNAVGTPLDARSRRAPTGRPVRSRARSAGDEQGLTAASFTFTRTIDRRRSPSPTRSCGTASPDDDSAGVRHGDLPGRRASSVADRPGRRARRAAETSTRSCPRPATASPPRRRRPSRCWTTTPASRPPATNDVAASSRRRRSVRRRRPCAAADDGLRRTGSTSRRRRHRARSSASRPGRRRRPVRERPAGGVVPTPRPPPTSCASASPTR